MSVAHKKIHTVIIGGGAAGMMAAISAKRHNKNQSVALLDRTFALGRKVLVCGAGRCNITNVNLDAGAVAHYYGADKEFIQSVLEQFSYEQIVTFFNDLGIELYTERKTSIGKVFPVTDQAKTVNLLLEDEMRRLGVDIYLNTEVARVRKSDAGFVFDAYEVENNQRTDRHQVFTSECLVISAGGRTYPALGSNGSGYELAKMLGHRIIDPVPSALPLEAKSPLSHSANGTKMEIEARSFINGKRVKSTVDDVMFTQYGLSGPAILNISREISIHLNRERKNRVEVELNFFPGKTASEVHNLLQSRWDKRPDQTVEMSMNGLLPPKIPPVLLQQAKIPLNKQAGSLTSQEVQHLMQLLTAYRVQVTATKGWNEAEFTAGGVDTSQVNPLTLESRIVQNLYFCGEILNVDGDVGGYNLSWAWSSGFVAGKSGGN
ncbi:MAG: NAD(P)/FAD-dependent oxidoreductase [Candidatus Dojkabacteria bacterium]